MEDYKYDIEYLPQFDTDFASILFYIKYVLKNDQASDKLFKNVVNSINKRSYFPMGFEKYQGVSDRKHKWYRIYVGNYTIFYTIKCKKIIVSRIFYNKRNFDELF